MIVALIKQTEWLEMYADVQELQSLSLKQPDDGTQEKDLSCELVFAFLDMA